MSKVNRRIISISVVALLVILSLGVSFAYFTAGLSSTGETASTINLGAGTLNIAFAGGDNITLRDIYPKDEAWGTKTFTVEGNNTTALKMPYNLSLVVETNTFTSGALQFDLLSVNTNNNGATVPSVTTKVSIPTGANTIAIGSSDGYFENAENAFHTYKLNIYFPDTTENQNVDQTKSFSAHVLITATNAYEGSTTTTTTTTTP